MIRANKLWHPISPWVWLYLRMDRHSAKDLPMEQFCDVFITAALLLCACWLHVRRFSALKTVDSNGLWCQHAAITFVFNEQFVAEWVKSLCKNHEKNMSVSRVLFISQIRRVLFYWVINTLVNGDQSPSCLPCLHEAATQFPPMPHGSVIWDSLIYHMLIWVNVGQKYGVRVGCIKHLHHLRVINSGKKGEDFKNDWKLFEE